MLAGGGGIALLMFILACLGVIGLIEHGAWKTMPPAWLLCLVAFLGWVWITQFWSPYPKVVGFSNAEKIGVMGMMFPAVIWLWAQIHNHPLGRILRAAVLASLTIGVALMAFEFLSDFKLSAIYEPPQPDEDPFWRKLDGIRNVGRGTIFASAIFMPAIALIWDNIWGKVAAFIVATILTFLAIKLNVSIAVPLPWLGLGLGLLAMRYPESVLKFVFVMAVLAVFLSPALASGIRFIGEATMDSVPSSWEHRLHMWYFVHEQISMKPLIGYGFDSSRTFADTVTLNNDKTVTLISLHTHNAGLQIWLETGFVGALLACLTIILLFNPALSFVKQSKIHAFGLCGFLPAFTLVSSVSFGVWQFWWWGVLSFGLACLHLLKPAESATKSMVE